jgi:hypothetical protein
VIGPVSSRRHAGRFLPLMVGVSVSRGRFV